MTPTANVNYDKYAETFRDKSMAQNLNNFESNSSQYTNPCKFDHNTVIELNSKGSSKLVSNNSKSYKS